jgi:tetratricopeptide (TPR) repeat protein
VTCRDASDVAARLAACSTLIQTGTEPRAGLIRAFASRGDAFLAQGNVDRAIQDYDRLLALEPDNADGLTKRCYAKAVRGRPQDALADCNRALNLRPGDAAALENRGFTYLRLMFFDAAIADYAASIAADARSASALYGRGVARRMRGDIVGGDADIAAARRLRPDIADVMAARGVSP